jgi:6-phosphogluconolactonase
MILCFDMDGPERFKEKEMRFASVLTGGTLCFALMSAAGAASIDLHGAHLKLEESSAGNHVVAYIASRNGTLLEAGRYATGGHSASPVPNAMRRELMRSGDVVLVPNSGSDTISSFRIMGDRMVLIDTLSSGGIRPVAISDVRSLDAPAFSFGHPGPGHLAGSAGVKASGVGFFYVLNHVGNMIQGFTVDSVGNISRVERSARLLDCGLLGKGAELRFALDGRSLIATDRYSENRSEMYVLPDGTLSDHAPQPAAQALVAPDSSAG